MMEEIRTPAIPQQAIEAFDEEDERAIVQHMSGGGRLDEYVYSFPIEGKPIVGVSWAGASEIARRIGNIEVLPDIKVEQTEDAYYGILRVRDNKSGVTILGTARQDKMMKLRTGEERPNRFAFNLALVKAQRNGILALVSENVKQGLIAEFLKLAKARQVPPARTQATPQTTQTKQPPLGAPPDPWEK